MENYKQKCKLCNKITASNKSEVIDDIIRDILDIVSLNLNLNRNSKNLICNQCSEKLLAAFEFKSTCLSTDGYIIPFIVPEEVTKIDLWNVYLKLKKKNHPRELDKDQKLCRLCMQLISGEFKSADEIDIDVKAFIPEINFDITRDPVICESCFKSLNVHVNFINDCLSKEKPNVLIEEMKLNLHESEEKGRGVSIKNEEVDIKLEKE